MTPVGLLLVAPLEDRFPAAARRRAPPYGIIILGGAIKSDESEARGQAVFDEGERVVAGRAPGPALPRGADRLHRRQRLADLDGSAIREAEEAKKLLVDLGVDPARVTLEDRSRNTDENARFTAALVHPRTGPALAAGDVGLPHAPLDGAVREGRLRRRRLSGRLPDARPRSSRPVVASTPQKPSDVRDRGQGVDRPRGLPGDRADRSALSRDRRTPTPARSRPLNSALPECARLIRRGRAEAIDAAEVVRIDHLALAGDHEPPLSASLTAARRTSDRCDRQPSSSSPRLSAKALAASVGQMVRPGGDAGAKLEIRASRASGESEAGHGASSRRGRAAPSRRRHGHRPSVAIRAATSIGRHSLSMSSRVLLITAKLVVLKHARFEAFLSVPIADVLNEALVVELDRVQPGVDRDVAQRIPVGTCVRQIDAHDGAATAAKPPPASQPRERAPWLFGKSPFSRRCSFPARRHHLVGPQVGQRYDASKRKRSLAWRSLLAFGSTMVTI